MPKNKIIMCIGKTHSGKTTFGKNLAKKIRGVVLETDPIALFLKKEFPINLDQDKEHDGTFREPSLKIKIYQLILDHILNLEKFPIILTNSNMHRKLRQQNITKFHQKNYEVIGVYFNYSEEFLRQRVKKANKDISVLGVSKNFDNLLEKQRSIFVEPNQEEFDYFFEVTDEKQLLEVEREIINLFKK